MFLLFRALLFPKLKIPIKGKINFLHVLQIFFFDILYKKLGIPLCEGFSVKDTDVFSSEGFIVERFVSFFRVDIVFFAEELDFVEGIDVFHSVSGFSDSDVELSGRDISLFEDVVGNILGVEDLVEESAIFLESFEGDLGLDFPEELVDFSLFESAKNRFGLNDTIF